MSLRHRRAVLKTTRRERTWGYLGPVLHWLYFTPLRRHGRVWSQSIIWLSIAGTVMCLSGLVWGLWRLSPAGRLPPEARPVTLPVRRHDEMAPLRRSALRLDDEHVDLQRPDVDDALGLEFRQLADATAARGGHRRSVTARSGHAPSDPARGCDVRRIVCREGSRGRPVSGRAVPRRLPAAGRRRASRLAEHRLSGVRRAGNARAPIRFTHRARARHLHQLPGQTMRSVAAGAVRTPR